ncbi:cytochrome P450 26C1 [Ambystoma mexicanum]|uniref:cytochrome P450 26C1 n=1 Tax=Ambystoma mexicanum TaxID=8296 RepID=UPI0037E75E89
MFLLEINYLSLLEAAATSVLSLLLLLALCRQLWALRWSRTRDRECSLPLPKGSMGWPFFGETLHWLVQGSDFHSSRRAKYGNVFKTHLLGKPLIRVTGAANVRRILLGEHSLVSSQWPHSTQIILGANTLVNCVGDEHRRRRKVMAHVFSASALESYIPRIQEAVSAELRGWCEDPGAVSVYAAAKALTFRIAARILLGLRLGELELQELAKTFEQLVENLFSLPLDIPFSGLRKGIKARNTLHEYMEKAITEKLQNNEPGGDSDALDFMINSAKEHGKEFTMQELKESAIELIFAAFFTTASASTSLVLLLLKHPTAIAKISQELASHGVNRPCQCPVLSVPPKNFTDTQRSEKSPLIRGGQSVGSDDHHQTTLMHPEGTQRERWQRHEKTASNTVEGSHLEPRLGANVLAQKEEEELYMNNNCNDVSVEQERTELVFNKQEMPRIAEAVQPSCKCRASLGLEQMSNLRYLDCVVKEVLRLLPPVSGGYRTALQTFELDGYQVPKGWSVMYNIRDTHETAAVFQSAELFDPDRFGPERDEGRAGRFNYIPFGGGARSCIGKELAQVILKLLAIELVATARWELATASFPKMQTVPIVHPVDGLHLYFHYLGSSQTKQVVQKEA